MSDNPSAAERISQLQRALTKAKACLQRAQQRQARNADLRRREVQLQVGDRVLLSTEHLSLKDPERSKKLLSRYIGPFPVRRVVSAVAYELELPSSMRIHPVFHVSKLKLYRDGKDAFPTRQQDQFERPPPEFVDEEGEEEWAVERILQKRTRAMGKKQKSIEYLVRWKGYPEWEATWEPAAHLIPHANEAIHEFEERARQRSRRPSPSMARC